MRRSTVAIVLFGAAFSVAALTACGGSQGRNAVHIESISPSAATFGGEVVIHGDGFAATGNDIGFGLNGARPSDEYDGNYSTGFLADVPSADGKTLRFELQDTLGACAYSRLDREAACVLIGLTIPVGETQVAVFNRNGVSNSVGFTRSMTRIEAADAEVRNSPAYKQLTEVLDRWIDDYYHPSIRSDVASYGFRIGEAEDGHLYVELMLSFIDPDGPNIPNEIAGYEVRVNATWIKSESPRS